MSEEATIPSHLMNNQRNNTAFRNTHTIMFFHISGMDSAIISTLHCYFSNIILAFEFSQQLYELYPRSICFTHILLHFVFSMEIDYCDNDASKSFVLIALFWVAFPSNHLDLSEDATIGAIPENSLDIVSIRFFLSIFRRKTIFKVKWKSKL